MAKSHEPTRLDLERTRRMLLDPHWTPPEAEAGTSEVGEEISYLWASLREQQERLDLERQHMDAWAAEVAETDAELLARRKRIIAGEDLLKGDRRRFQAVMVVNWLVWAAGFAILGSFGRTLIARHGAPVDTVIALLALFAAVGWIAAVFAVPASSAVGTQWSATEGAKFNG